MCNTIHWGKSRRKKKLAVDGFAYRCAVQDQDQCSCQVAHSTEHNDNPDEDPIEFHRRSRDQAKVAEAERGFESSYSELIERTSCIIELLFVSRPD